ncbi:MAG: VOC family protein [Gammaproteobacteria bacterium WSBS_2016_MAG_OTU1]
MGSSLSHITVGTNDSARAVAFYDVVLGVLGFKRLARPADKPQVYSKNNEFPYIYLYYPEDGRPATWGNGTHIAFMAETQEQVHAFYDGALNHGGSDEGAPGLRPHFGDNYYAAYVRDPDGNKLQAVCYIS